MDLSISTAGYWHGISLHPVLEGTHMHGLEHFGVSFSLLKWIIGSDDMLEEQIVCLDPLNVPKDSSKGEEREGTNWKHAYATEVHCQIDPEMDRVGTKTNPCHQILDRSGSGQIWER